MFYIHIYILNTTKNLLLCRLIIRYIGLSFPTFLRFIYIWLVLILIVYLLSFSTYRLRASLLLVYLFLLEHYYSFLVLQEYMSLYQSLAFLQQLHHFQLVSFTHTPAPLSHSAGSIFPRWVRRCHATNQCASGSQAIPRIVNGPCAMPLPRGRVA